LERKNNQQKLGNYIFDKYFLASTFHHVSKHHLHRYFSWFDFRYNYRKIEDELRTVILIKHAEALENILKIKSLQNKRKRK